MKKIIFKNQEQEVEILYQKEISKISENFPQHGKMFFVCDVRVLEKNPQMNKLLNENVYLVKNPEKEKDLQSTIRILKFLKDNGCNRNDHLIAIGGGGFGREIKNLKIEKYIINQSKSKKPKICFIPTATGDDEGYIKNFYKAFD